MKTRIRLLMVACALWGLAGCTARPAETAETAKADASARPEEYGKPVAIGAVGDERVTEASGIVVSVKNPGVLWVHNDSGDGPYLYALARDGKPLGRLKITGVWTEDAEDMTLGRCDDDWCLFFGDIGDNRRHRHDTAVYRVVEPALDINANFGETLVHADRFSFNYPEGPRDAEALAWHPSGALFIFSKESDTTRVYRFPSLVPGKKVTLEKVLELPTKKGRSYRVTAADFSDDGKRLLLRTYKSVWEYDIDPADIPGSLKTAKRRDGPSPIEPQGEAIAYDLATRGYLTVSEGDGEPIYSVPGN